MRYSLSAVLLLLLLSAPALADWNVGDPAKYVQLPDIQSGMDVNATWNGQYPFVKVLADDFPCIQTGPITDVHIWGSWLNDNVDPNTLFRLSIHGDVPADPVGGVPYSHPVRLLWSGTFSPSDYEARLYATEPTGVTEPFYDPNNNQIIGGDTKIWQYNFLVPPSQAFVQQGTPSNPTIYWLDVQAMPLTTTSQAIFGWKTSYQHFQDDAVFADTDGFGGPLVGPLPGAPFWLDMHDPRTQQSLDMSFVITTVPEPSTFALLGAGVISLLIYVWRASKQIP